MSMLAFIVPLTHPAACRSWGSVLIRLQETLRSIESCIKNNMAFGVVVANHEAELPKMPSGIHVLRINLAPPTISVFSGEVPEDQRRKVKRLDKGTKVLFGSMFARDQGAQYIMNVDADDLISRRIPGYVATNKGAPGWYVNEGWVLPVGSKWAYRAENFDHLCGTSLIIRTDLFNIPDSIKKNSPKTISRNFGSHKFIADDLAAKGYPLEPIPFAASVYRTGHGENNSNPGSLFELYFKRNWSPLNPVNFLGKIAKLRPFGNRLRQEFHAGLHLE